VGKSALINKLLGRRLAKTADTPGITRSLQWIRVRNNNSINSHSFPPLPTASSTTSSTFATRTTTKSTTNKSTTTINDRIVLSPHSKNEFELLDSPGVIPANIVDQSDAMLLAACNCIGSAAYDNQAVAAYLCDWLLLLWRHGYGPIYAPDWIQQCQSRYNIHPLSTKEKIHNNDNENDGEMDQSTTTTIKIQTGDDMVWEIAHRTCHGNTEDSARKILQDFRSGRWGLIALQIAPTTLDMAKQHGHLPLPLVDSHRRVRRWRRQRRNDTIDSIRCFFTNTYSVT
jgi:ribosome biogenesis GTPase A